MTVLNNELAITNDFMDLILMVVLKLPVCKNICSLIDKIKLIGTDLLSLRNLGHQF